MNNFQENYDFIMDNFASGYFSMCIKESGALLESILKEVYQKILFNCPIKERETLFQVEQEIGKNQKQVSHFTLGELVKLSKKINLMDKAERFFKHDLLLVKSYDLYPVVKLRNECVHNSYSPSKFEAQYVVQCLLTFLVGFEKINIDDAGYLFGPHEAGDKIKTLENKLENMMQKDCFQMVSISKELGIWEGFIDQYYAWNPSWQTESIIDEDEWFSIHAKRYQEDYIRKVHYIIPRDSTCGGLFKSSNYFGIKPFIKYCSLLFDNVEQFNQKIRIYLADDLNSRISYFVGKVNSGYRSIVLINDDPFIKGEFPAYALVSENDSVAQMFMEHFNAYRTTLQQYTFDQLLKESEAND